MGSVTSGLTGGKVTLAGASTPTIYNVTAAVPNIEYSQALSADTVKITVRSRSGANTRIAFSSGDTIVSWITIPGGATWAEDGLRLSSATLYFQCDAADILEILEWT